MPKSKVAINSAFLATKEKSEERKLILGKISVNPADGSLIFYLLEILSPWLPTNKVETAIHETLKKVAENKPEFSAQDFEDTLRDINLVISELAQEKEIDWVGNINALIGYGEGNKLHLSMFGNIEGYLIRDTKISKITEGLSPTDPNPLKLFSSITTGGLLEGDRVLISNLGLYNNISIERSRRIVANLNARESLKEFHSLLRKMKASDINATILEITNTENLDKEQDEDRYPEFLYLDQASKNIWDLFVKKAKPVLKSAGLNTIKGGKKTGKALGNLFKHTQKKIRDDYGPKSKELLGSSKKYAKKSFSNVSGKINKAPGTPTELTVKPYKGKNSWFKKIMRSLSRSINRSVPFFRNIWSWSIQKENRRYIYIISAILLVIIVYFKITANNENRSELKNERDLVVAIADAKDLFNQAKEDMALKREGGEDKLLEALDLAKSALDHPVTATDAKELIKEIQAKIDDETGAVRFTGLEESFFTKDNTIASELAGSVLYSITLDGKIFATDTREKTPTLVASIGSDKGEVLDISYAESTKKVYIYTDQNKMLALDTATDTIENITVSQEGSDWQKSVAIATYSSNIYTLDNVTGEVWRHSALTDGLSKGTDYLDTRQISIVDAVDVTIDGNIYVLKNDAEVAKFVRGAWDVDFKLGELPAPGSTIEEPSQIFSDSDSNFIYILDKKLNRIVRFDKNGSYSNQFIFDDFTIDQFFVNPRLQTMWVISSGHVYEVSL